MSNQENNNVQIFLKTSNTNSNAEGGLQFTLSKQIFSSNNDFKTALKSGPLYLKKEDLTEYGLQFWTSYNHPTGVTWRSGSIKLIWLNSQNQFSIEQNGAGFVISSDNTDDNVAYPIYFSKTIGQWTNENHKGNNEEVINTDNPDIEDENGTIAFQGHFYNEVISPITGKIWLDRNLGAKRPCKSFDDKSCFGGYYQWGRIGNGHENTKGQISNSYEQATKVDLYDYENAKSYFIRVKFLTKSMDWAFNIDKSGTLRHAIWSSTDGTGVCPVGFRVPTQSELEAETITQGIDSNSELFKTFLKIPTNGGRDFSTGNLSTQGQYVSLWTLYSEKVDDYTNDPENKKEGYMSKALFSAKHDSSAYFAIQFRAAGKGIRCIKD
jgi:hypothetical protein